MVGTWSQITITALQDTWRGFLIFLPKLIGSLVVLIIGWLIANGIGRLVSEILKKLKFNNIFERTGWRGALIKADLEVDPADFVGAVAKWMLVIVFLLASVQILEFKAFEFLLKEIIAWLPNLIVAIAIFVVAIILADILEKIIKASVEKIDVGYVGFIGLLIRWSIYVFAGLIILRQLEVTPTIIDTLVQGFVGMIALAFGLAFGLGGKDAAASLIDDLKKKIS